MNTGISQNIKVFASSGHHKVDIFLQKQSQLIADLVAVLGLSIISG